MESTAVFPLPDETRGRNPISVFPITTTWQGCTGTGYRPMTRIAVLRGGQQIRVCELAAGTLTIGRAEDNTLHLDDRTISKHHARIVTYFEATHVEDLGSTNGTYVNGKKVHKQVLQPGDVLKIGQHQLRLDPESEQVRTFV